MVAGFILEFLLLLVSMGLMLANGDDRLCAVRSGSGHYFSFMVRSADNSCCIAIWAETCAWVSRVTDGSERSCASSTRA